MKRKRPRYFAHQNMVASVAILTVFLLTGAVFAQAVLSAQTHQTVSLTDVQTLATPVNQAGVQTDKPHSEHNHENDEATYTDSKPKASLRSEPGHDVNHEIEHGKSEAHDHAAHHHGSGSSFANKLISWLGKFHPPTTHFPIALIIAALFAEGLFVVTGKPMFNAAARFTVWFAIIGTLAAVILGWFFGGFKLSDDDWIMTTHRWVGTAAGLWTLVLAWTACKAWAESPVNATKWRKWFRTTLAVAVLLISVNGFLGGALIYSLSHYGW